MLHAISATGGQRDPRLEKWLVTKATKPAAGTRPGLFDGLHGAAFAMRELGYTQEALDVLDIVLTENWESLGSDLASGLTGIGLNLLHFADETGEPALREAGLRAAALVAERLDDDPDDTPLVSGGENPFAGLMRGHAGQALFLIRAYDDTGKFAAGKQPNFKQIPNGMPGLQARLPLLFDAIVSQGRFDANRFVAWTATEPAKIYGLDEYLTRRHDDRFAAAARGVELAARSTMYILPGLFNGRSGILYYRARRAADPLSDPEVAKQIRNLAWHALPYADGMAFPGNEMLRLSMDLATGTAGVLLALGSVLHDRPVTIPLLAPSKKAEPQTPAPTGVGR